VPLVNRDRKPQDRRRNPDLRQREASVRITVCEFPDDAAAFEIDLAEADNAKLNYPRNVKDPPGSLETIS
jgi:hypothetical protein